MPSEVTASHSVRRIGQILMNGKKYSKSRFIAHNNLVAPIRQCYDIELERWNNENSRREPQDEQFCKALALYLVTALNHVPQAAKQEEQATLIHDIRELVGQFGVLPIAQYLMRAASAPVDMF